MFEVQGCVRLPVSRVTLTIGIVVVAVLAASEAGLLPGVAITATRRRTRSAMSDGRRLYWPSRQWLHRHILTLDVAGFVEAITECSGRLGINRRAGDESDNRHRRLLRARRERHTPPSVAKNFRRPMRLAM